MTLRLTNDTAKMIGLFYRISRDLKDMGVDYGDADYVVQEGRYSRFFSYCAVHNTGLICL